ncbi:MAG: PQQ-binding-like beta-propeller repeat protein [Saprospiraceae bacterium]|nr:PQQ-binding-like beta-propeller repeat protein [Saprospiraceae bacterium]
MQKTFTCLLGMLLPVLLFGQTTWYRTLPFSSVLPTFYDMSADGDGYVVANDKNAVQLDKFGTALGSFTIPAISQFTSDVLKRYHPVTGHPYFILARRNVTPPTGYFLTEYRPGASGLGMVNTVTIADSLGQVSGQRPTLLEQPDGSILVIGKQFYRKMTYDPATGFTEVWMRPFNMAATAVLQNNNRLIAADAAGKIIALDENGDLLWTQNHGFNIRSLASTPNGLVACGQNTNNSAVVLRMDNNGTELWREETSDKDYFDVLGNPDFTFTATGLSAEGNIVLTLLASNGSVLWQQTYTKGTGLHLLPGSDGGYVVLARAATPGTIHVLKTDGFGQTDVPQKTVFKERRLKSTLLEATLFPKPSMFFDGENATFLSTNDSAATIFTFSPWIGGVDPEGNLKLAVSQYDVPFSDFANGPFNGQPDDFDQVWLATRKEIKSMRLDFDTDGSLDNPVPFDLLTWPGKGNPHFKYNLGFLPVTTNPDLFPAPFVDVNNDGLYNVYDGDYPEIKGDQMVWMCFNDKTSHEQSNGNMLEFNLEIEIYTYDCVGDPTINGSFFAHFDIKNMANERADSIFMGFFTDFDLGCYTDDYLGVLPDVKTFYAYNATANDADCLDVNGFGSQIPVQSITFLNRELSHFTPMFIGSGGSIPMGANQPILPNEYYNYLTGTWRDGTPLTYGGTGYNPGSSDVVPIAFPDNPSDPQGWSMCNNSFPAVYDFTSVASHGPFVLQPTQTFSMGLAFTFHPDIEHPCPNISNIVQPTLELLQTWYANGNLDARPDLGTVRQLQSGQTVTLNPGWIDGASFLWSTGETSQTIVVTQPGYYAVTVTSPTGCQWEDYVLVQLATGTINTIEPANWSIHPNPANTYATITCASGTQTDGASVVVRNSQGSVVRRLETVFGPQIRLETDGLSSGMYWVEMWDGSRFGGAKKLVVGR